jgi:hypothetical protein
MHNQKIDKLPKNVKFLDICWCVNNNIILPKNLKNILLSCDNYLINNIPEQIENIYIIFYWTNNKRVDNLPSTIKKISIYKNEYEKFL